MNNNGELSTFYRLLDKNEILIPKIQRDYVQGRKSVRIKRNRKTFVDALVNAICEPMKNQINLNFIYGYMNKKAQFIPIDGQQRLTTLFLLHAYIFARASHIENLNKLKKFFYETRYISKRFFENLIENIISVCETDAEIDEIYKSSEELRKEQIEIENAISKNSGNLEQLLKQKAEIKFKLNKLKLISISERIKSTSWFSTRWLEDSTVNSALIVLDEIENCFKSKENLDFDACADILVNSSPISFMILKIDNLGKPEDLYIKMNARGKSLTEFENFKADLYEQINKSDFGDFDILKFKKSIDGDWLDFIWSLFEDEKAFENTDEFYRNIFHWVLTTCLAEIFNKGAYKIYKSNKTDAEWEERQKIIKSIIEYKPDDAENKKIYDSCCQKISVAIKEDVKIFDYYINDYLIGTNANFVNCIKDFSYLFDLLFEIRKEDCFGELKEEIFYTLLSDSKKMSYPERTLLFAIIKYSKKYKDQTFDLDKFKDWWRFFKNLINNTVIDKEKPFCDALTAIKNFDYDLTPDNCKKITFFNKTQIAEEYLKLKLSEDPSWKEKIYEIENNFKYFCSEILFSFNLICNELPVLNEETIDDRIFATIDTIYEKIKLDDFKTIWQKICKFFDANGLIVNFDEKYLFRRALLTYGDYSFSTYGDEANSTEEKRYTMFFEGKKNYYNWRRMLRTTRGLNVFKKFINAFNLNEDPQNYMNNLIEKFPNAKTSEKEILFTKEMLYYIIKHEDVFDFMSENRYAYDAKNKRIVILSGATLQSQYAEINTYLLAVLLNKKEDYVFGQGAFDNDKYDAYLKINDNCVRFCNNMISFKNESFTYIADAANKIKNNPL